MQAISLLAPGLLLSMPQLSDPNFTRAVVLMLEHDEEGSFGLIVNQESELTVAELLKELDTEWTGAADESVWSGGPVMPGSGWMLHNGSEHLGPSSATLRDALDETGTLKVADGLFMSTSVGNIRILSQNPADRMRLILGYSGWSTGQLASEMAAGSWLHCDIDIDILFDCPARDMWERCLQSMGLSPETIVQSRGIH
ncbi:MAG: YqgE/AlgH family protein [Myxococcales bacterium]|nr:YqgE/AlgH family protein [Myxococcales bacterium]